MTQTRTLALLVFTLPAFVVIPNQLIFSSEMITDAMEKFELQSLFSILYFNLAHVLLSFWIQDIPSTNETNQAFKQFYVRRMTQNLKIRIVTRVVLLVHTLKISQQMETPLLLAEELV